MWSKLTHAPMMVNVVSSYDASYQQELALQKCRKLPKKGERFVNACPTELYCGSEEI
jgi:hypothetical protein